MNVSLQLLGHACFGIDRAGARLIIDPYPGDGFGGRLNLDPVGAADAVITTHDHADHAAVEAAAPAQVLVSPTTWGSFAIDHTVCAHDEFGGRLRGGSSRVLRIRINTSASTELSDASPDITIVHCGDIGERAQGPLLAWLRDARPDVLIVPVGGYYTLGPDGAAELVARVNPRFAIPCHSADDGWVAGGLNGVSEFVRRFEHVDERSELQVTSRVTGKFETQVVRLTPQRLRSPARGLLGRLPL